MVDVDNENSIRRFRLGARRIVNISDQPISSPIVSTYDVVVVFNQPSLKKFERSVKKGGILIWETTHTKELPTRKDLRIFGIPAEVRAQPGGGQYADRPSSMKARITMPKTSRKRAWNLHPNLHCYTGVDTSSCLERLLTSKATKKC
jgi:hypothetical protein